MNQTRLKNYPEINFFAVEFIDFKNGIYSDFKKYQIVDPKYIILLGKLWSITEESFNFAMDFANNHLFDDFIFDLSKVKFSPVVFDSNTNKIISVHLSVLPVFL